MRIRFNVQNKVRLDYLFYIAYALFLFYWMFSMVDALDLIRVIAIKITHIILVVMALVNLLTAGSWKNKIVMLVCLLVSVASYFISGSNNILLIFLFAVLAKDINFRAIEKYDVALKTAFLLIVVLLSFLGIAESYSIYRADGTVRASLGFSHPNVFGLYIFSLCLEWIYIIFNKTKKSFFASVGIIIAGMVLIEVISDSRTAMLGLFGVAMIILLEFLGINKKICKGKLSLFIKFSFVIFAVLSLGLVGLYRLGNGLAKDVNNATSNRVELASYYLERYDLSLFGSQIKTLGTREAAEQNKKSQAKVLDNSYVMVLLKYGVMSFAMMGFLYVMTTRKVINNEEYFLAMVLVLMSAYGLMENVLIYLQYDVFLLLFSKVIYGGKNVKKSDKKY